MLREAFERPMWALGGQRLHPAQLGELLEERMRAGRVGLAGGTYAPERYVLLLNPDDVRRFGALRPEVEQGLAEHLDGVRRLEGYALRAPLMVTMREDKEVAPGSVEVDASYVEELTRGPSLRLDRAARTDRPELDAIDVTTRIDREAVLAAIGRANEGPSASAVAVLALLDGKDQEGELYGVESLPCTIGRSPDCDITLTDLRVSRLHARLRRGVGGITVADLGSANGVRVNGAPAEESILTDGDELTLGGPRFRVHLLRSR